MNKETNNILIIIFKNKREDIYRNSFRKITN